MADRLRLAGEAGPVVIVRDDYGIPHVWAETAADAWLGMGYACAQDRMFQMDYDRRRAAGRWAEVAGGAALGEDILARRLGLAAAARRDVDAMSAPLRSAFDAYARGVNLVIGSGARPFEAESTGYDLERWQPWHSVAAFKVRHVLMGHWQLKLAQARLLARIGPEAFGRLEIRPAAGSPLAVPPDGRLTRLVDEAVTDVARHLGFLAEAEPGSNAWAVSAARTAHGAAVLCNDSHRTLETPNVYWQCQLTCPEFDVIGATFPALPGFPHFGHNGRVAWAITHADADTQDLYLERFEGARCLTPEGWREAERHSERIDVRGGGSRDIQVFQTRHGPVVHGDPADGIVIALKYTATYRPDRGFECLLPMLAARDVAELADGQQGWVDPVNNLVAADVGGRIGYQCRGELPVRSSAAHRGLPVPGWDGECEWVGTVPFGELPRAIDPAAGFVLTANNVIVDGDEPYISYTFAQPFRAEQIRERLADRALHTTEDLAAMQADTGSWAARAWGRLLGGLGGLDGGDTSAEAAWRMLAGWDGDLAAGSGRALLYGCFQRALAEELYRPLVGDETWAWLVSANLRPTVNLIRRWLANDSWELLGGPVSAPSDGSRGRRVLAAVPAALAGAWASAISLGGPEPDRWHWGDVHRARGPHPLAGVIEMALPTPVRMGGDADTLQASGYGWRRDAAFDVTSLSVYRQVIDLGSVDAASYVIPGGSSGDPRSPHFADQLAEWAEHRRVPMRYPPSSVTPDLRLVMGLSSTFLRSVAGIVGETHVLTGDAAAGFAVDWTGFFRGQTPAVVRPRDTGEVAAVLALCTEAGVAVVPQGGKTGLVGGGVPRHGEVVLSLTRLNQIGAVDREAAQVTAGAGVTLRQVADADPGLDLGVLIASRDSATVGGAVATNAGGLRVLRFGPMRAQLRGIEAVLSDGSVLSHLGGLVKDNTGYDYPSLLAGSEGTLAVITAARLRLVPRMRDAVTVIVGVGGLDEVHALARRAVGEVPGLVSAEYFAQDGLDILVEHAGLVPPLPVPTPTYLLLEAFGPGALEDLAAVICDREAVVGTSATDRTRLWAYRERLPEAAGFLGVAIKLDVSVPAAQWIRLARDVAGVVAAVDTDAVVVGYGHVADGNVQVNIVPGAPADGRHEDAVLSLVASLGGSISAEHGIGALKARWLPLARSEAERALFARIRAAFDPAGTLNPHVLPRLPAAEYPAEPYVLRLKADQVVLADHGARGDQAVRLA